MSKRKGLFVVISLCLVFSLSTTALADPKSELEAERKIQEEKLKNSESDLSSAKSKVDKLNTEVEKLDNQIEGLIRETQENKKQIESTQKQIKEVEKDITKAESDIKDEQKLFEKRMRSMYMNGSGGYLDVILESKGLSDFFSRIEAVKTVIEYDKKMIGDLKDKKADIVSKKEELSKKNSKLLALKAENDAKMDKLSKSKQAQYDKLAVLSQETNKYKAERDKLKGVIDAIDSKIANLPSGNGGSGTGGTSSGGSSGGLVKEVYTGNNPIVAYAYKFQGYKYVWGGKGPTYFDCSGFMQYVYRHFGYEVGDYTGTQRDAGIAVNRSDLKEGDLIFFGDDYYSIHHVGMYVGNGKFIHAPRTGDVIRVAYLSNRDDYYSARRIVR